MFKELRGKRILVERPERPKSLIELTPEAEQEAAIEFVKTLNKLPDDTGIHYTSMDSYNRVLSNFLRNTQMTNQDNKGLSVSRNIGIEAAKGEYILFMDSDDLLENEIKCAVIKGVAFLLQISSFLFLLKCFNFSSFTI